MLSKKVILSFILFYFYFPILNSQQVLSSTFSNFSMAGMSRNKVNLMSTLGETFTGVRNLDKHVIIEGFYAYNNFKLDTLPPQVTPCRIFPNPARGKFVVFNESNNFQINIAIYSLSGVVVKRINIAANAIAQVNDLPVGIYIIQILYKDKLRIKQTIFKQIIIN